jgi:hypothetical protein
MLSVVFFFLALGAYQWYARRPIARRMFIVGFFYGLGLLAKPQVIMLPFVLLLWDYWPLERVLSATPNLDETIPASDGVPRKTFPVLLKEKTFLFLIALVYAVVTMVAEHKASPTDWPYTFSIRLGNAILSYSRYIGKAFWPVHLAFMYPHPGLFLALGSSMGLVITVACIECIRIRTKTAAALPHSRMALVCGNNGSYDWPDTD